MHGAPGCSAIAMRIVDLFVTDRKGTARYDRVPAKGRKDHAFKRGGTICFARMIRICNLIILLIDERPEEVTDIKEAIAGR